MFDAINAAMVEKIGLQTGHQICTPGAGKKPDIRRTYDKAAQRMLARHKYCIFLGKDVKITKDDVAVLAGSEFEQQKA